MFNNFRIVALSFFCMLTAGCSTDPIIIPLTTNTKNYFHAQPVQCSVKLGSITDKRADKNSLGMSGNQVFRGLHIENWIRQTFLPLQTRLNPEKASVVLNVNIEQTYLDTFSTIFSVNVLLKIDYVHHQKTIHKIYRGHVTHANLLSAGFLASFNEAVSQILPSVEQDIYTICHSR